MKKVLWIVSVMLWSCGGSSDDAPPPEKSNDAPTIPALFYPTNNLLCTDSTVSFSWEAARDANNDPIEYMLQVATDNQFGTLDFSAKTTTTSHAFKLEKGVSYYWRVKASDDKNASSNFSPVFSFYTQGEAVSNHLPFSPQLVSPILNAKIDDQLIDLKWSANDVDNDPLSFDVYFGTDNPPMLLVGHNQPSPQIQVQVTSKSKYYWYVVVKDNRGGVTFGQIWDFDAN